MRRQLNLTTVLADDVIFKRIGEVKLKKYTKKLIAPIVIILVIVAYFATLGVTLLALPLPIWGKALAIIVPVIFAGIGVYVLIERIKEIRSGEEDDLSKY